MKQNKLEKRHSAFLIICMVLSLIVVPVKADEEYHVIASLQAPEPISSESFGTDIKQYEGGLVVGTHSSGKVYIYDSDWNLTTIVHSPPESKEERFGHSVDARGDKLAVSNMMAPVGDHDRAGTVYIFDSEGSLDLELIAPVPRGRMCFGPDVALTNDIILVSTLRGTVGTIPNAGIVHVYDYEGGYIRNFTSPSLTSEGVFGWSLATSDEYVLVGEPGYLFGYLIPDLCSVYVFDYSWNSLATLNAPDRQERTCFGVSTSISGDYVVVGEPWATVDGNEKAGRAHIFDTDWNHVATLQSPTPEALAEFGWDVVIGGDIVVVGERKGDVEVMNEGKAHVFDLEGNIITTLVSPEPAVASLFGHSVETDGEVIVVGEIDQSVDGISKAGKVHIYGPGPAVEVTPDDDEIIVDDDEDDSTKQGGIPGFPYESILLGVVSVILVLWLIQKRR